MLQGTCKWQHCISYYIYIYIYINTYLYVCVYVYVCVWAVLKFHFPGYLYPCSYKELQNRIETREYYNTNKNKNQLMQTK